MLVPRYNESIHYENYPFTIYNVYLKHINRYVCEFFFFLILHRPHQLVKCDIFHTCQKRASKYTHKFKKKDITKTRIIPQQLSVIGKLLSTTSIGSSKLDNVSREEGDISC